MICRLMHIVSMYRYGKAATYILSTCCTVACAEEIRKRPGIMRDRKVELGIRNRFVLELQAQYT